MANALLYYLIVINIVTFLVVALDLWSLATNGTQEGQARQLAHTRSYLADTGTHRWQHRSFAWHEGMAA